MYPSTKLRHYSDIIVLEERQEYRAEEVWSGMSFCLKDLSKFKIWNNEYNPLCDKNAFHACVI